MFKKSIFLNILFSLIQTRPKFFKESFSFIVSFDYFNGGFKMTKLMIFDLDGTILDTIHTIAYYANRALKLNNIKEIETETYKYLVGKGAHNLIKGMLELKNNYSEEIFNKVFNDYNVAYNRNTTYKTEIFPGLQETLDKIKKMGIKLAVLSNKPHFATVSVTEKLYGKGYFDLILGQRENVPIKPDTTAVYEILDYFNVKKEECIYIGDTSTDMETGKNAEIFTAGVLWGFRKREELEKSGADIIIENTRDLIDMVK